MEATPEALKELEARQALIDTSPFKGYLEAEVSPDGKYVVNKRIVSQKRLTNRRRAYLKAYIRLSKVEVANWVATSVAISLASKLGIPIYNLYNEDSKECLEFLIESLEKELL